MFVFIVIFSLRGYWMMGKGKTSRVLKQSLETGNMEKTKQGSMETSSLGTHFIPWLRHRWMVEQYGNQQQGESSKVVKQR